MKKTQAIELLLNIRTTFVSFFSIAMFVALGVAVFLGLQWSSDALETTSTDLMRRTNMHDIEVQFPYGLTNQDVAKLRAVEGVADVEQCYASFTFSKINGWRQTFKVMSLTERLDGVDVVAGTLPTKDGQIAVQSSWAENNGIMLGDTIKFDYDDPDSDLPYLKSDTFEVTAFINSAGYMARSTSTYGMATIGDGSINCVAYVPKASFYEVYFLGGTPLAYVRCEGTEGLSPYSDEYHDVVAAVVKRINGISNGLADARIKDVKKFLVAAQDLISEVKQDKDLPIEPTAVGTVEDVLDMAQRELSRLEFDDWVVIASYGNGGMIMAQTFTTILSQLRFSMAALFVFVGLLVCYSAVSRIVHEQVVAVGTKKALGIHTKEVASSYLVYSALAVVLGLIVGVLAAMFVVEGILNPVLSWQFLLGNLAPYFSAADLALVGGVELALILAATWFSCHGVLKRKAVDLLSGDRVITAKQRFYERLGIWKKMPLLSQTVANNCVNDKRRVFSTLTGVAGCTALVVCALTLNNDVMNSFTRHYADVYSYNAVCTLASGDEQTVSAAQDMLSQNGSTSTPVFRSNYAIIEPDGRLVTTSMAVPMDSQTFGDFYHLHSVSGNEVDLSQEGVWLSAGYGQDSGVKVGDQITIMGSSGARRQLTVLGYYEAYLMEVSAVMGAAAYEQAFGTAPTVTNLLVNTGGKDVNELATQITVGPQVARIWDDTQATYGAFRQFQQLSRTVVLVYLGLSALMAVVVLLNLDVMFVEEKRKELIVLMICGFSLKHAKGYVRNDSIALTILGIIIGIVIGSVAGVITVGTVEPRHMLFLREVSAQACLMGAAACAFFASIVGHIAFRRISRFSLTDINRF